MRRRSETRMCRKVPAAAPVACGEGSAQLPVTRGPAAVAIGGKGAGYRRGVGPGRAVRLSPGSSRAARVERLSAPVGAAAAAMAKGILFGAALLMCFSVLLAVQKPPTVQVYSRHPVEIGKSNILNCYAEGFHPPKINITLLKNEQPLNAKQTDLSFKEDWTFQLLTYTEVFPNGKDRYSCKVEHAALENPKLFQWGRTIPAFKDYKHLLAVFLLMIDRRALWVVFCAFAERPLLKHRVHFAISDC